ncbi:MAG: TolC family protein [Gemmataceae bacterium]|nr:TolC family protein [Gemmataceae bacterium]
MRTMLLLALGAGGCAALPPLAVPPEVSPPLPIHEARYAAPPASPKELPAPGRAPSSGLTLDEAIARVLVADPKLRAGFEAINQANGDLVTAELKPNPTLSVLQSLLPLGRPFTVGKTGGPPQLDGILSWPVDWFVWGRRAANMASASLGVRGSEADYADLIRTRVGDTAQAFFAVLEARELVEVARQDVEGLEGVLKVVTRAVGAGGKPKMEQDRIRVDLLNSRRTLRDAETALAASKARLRQMFGYTGGDPGFDVRGSLDEAPAEAPLDAESAYAVALKQRPDLLSLHLKLQKSQADVVAEDRKGYPDLAVQAGLTRQFQEKAIGAPDASSYALGLVVAVPVFNRNQGNRLKAMSVVAQNHHLLKAGMADARSEIEQSLAELLTAQANAQALGGEQLRLAAGVRDAVTRAYEVGGRTLLEVLDARRSYRDTMRAAITVRAAAWRALYRFRTAIGQQVTTHDPSPRSAAP